MTTLLFIGGLGPPELLLIAGVLILLFGASKLPKLARSMGSATGEFKKGRKEVEEELDEIKGGGSADSEGEPEPEIERESDLGDGLEPEIEQDTDPDDDLDADRDPEQTGA